MPRDSNSRKLALQETFAKVLFLKSSKRNLVLEGTFRRHYKRLGCIFFGAGSESESRVIYSDNVAQGVPRKGYRRRPLLARKATQCTSRTAAMRSRVASLHLVFKYDTATRINEMDILPECAARVV